MKFSNLFDTFRKNQIMKFLIYLILLEIYNQVCDKFIADNLLRQKKLQKRILTEASLIICCSVWLVQKKNSLTYFIFLTSNIK